MCNFDKTYKKMTQWMPELITEILGFVLVQENWEEPNIFMHCLAAHELSLGDTSVQISIRFLFRIMRPWVFN